MAKDPAVLFYTSDFLTGTLLMTNEQKGKYITLLCLQHQKGVLSEKDMINICSSYDKDVFEKFIKTDEGYYNERMRFEHNKRSNFSKSRSENRLNGIANKGIKKKKKKSLSYDNHMENENEYLNYTFIGEKFKVCFIRWLNYKKERSETYKSLDSTETCYKKLLKFSNSNPTVAEEIINDAIGNNYAGFFEPKNKPKPEQSLVASSNYPKINQ